MHTFIFSLSLNVRCRPITSLCVSDVVGDMQWRYVVMCRSECMVLYPTEMSWLINSSPLPILSITSAAQLQRSANETGNSDSKNTLPFRHYSPSRLSAADRNTLGSVGAGLAGDCGIATPDVHGGEARCGPLG